MGAFPPPSRPGESGLERAITVALAGDTRGYEKHFEIRPFEPFPKFDAKSFDLITAFAIKFDRDDDDNIWTTSGRHPSGSSCSAICTRGWHQAVASTAS